MASVRLISRLQLSSSRMLCLDEGVYGRYLSVLFYLLKDLFKFEVDREARKGKRWPDTDMKAQHSRAVTRENGLEKLADQSIV